MNDRSTVASCFVWITVCIATCCGLGFADEATEAVKRRNALVSLAREHTLVAPDSDKTFQLSSGPVVNYTNPVRDRGTSDGVTLLWLDGELPVAVSSFSLRRPDDDLHFECTSFSESPLELRHNGELTWMPSSWQSSPKVAPRLPTPATTPARRLSQMRQFSRQFDVQCSRRGSEIVTPLRLLPQPLYRYSDEESGVVDGALFAFVISNDPEVLLHLTAVREKEAMVWKYSLARMTSLEVDVQLNGKVVWQVPNFYENGKSLTQPYIEGRLQSLFLL